MARLWACACGALNRSTDEQCEACGKPSTEGKSVEQRYFANPAPISHVMETHRPAALPDHREPSPEDDVLIRAEMAKVNALLGITPEDLAAPVSRLPSVNPEIRALIDAKMGELKGAPR